MRRLTAEQEALLSFIEEYGKCTERDIQKAFAVKGSDWLTLRNRIDSLIKRGLVENIGGSGSTRDKYGTLTISEKLRSSQRRLEGETSRKPGRRSKSSGKSKPKEDQLLTNACEAMKNAYAPYSHFKVGASLITKSGKIFSGCNVENSSYGLTICAERNAIFQAVAAGENVVQELVIFTEAAEPTSPCGACRQVIHEFGPNASIYAFTASGKFKTWRMNDLLPWAFTPLDLGKAGTPGPKQKK